MVDIINSILMDLVSDIQITEEDIKDKRNLLNILYFIEMMDPTGMYSKVVNELKHSNKITVH